MQPDGYRFPFVDGEDSQYELILRARGDRTPEDGHDQYFSQKSTEELLTTLEAAGITLDNDIAAKMGLFDIEPTYGGFMGVFGRHISRLINYPAVATSYFEQPNGIFERLESLGAAEPAKSPVVGLYMDVLQQIGARGLDTLDTYSSIATTNGERDNSRQASCHEAEMRYLQSRSTNTLMIRDIDGLPFCQKSSGERSFLSVAPVTYKGIELPPGWIFARSIDSRLQSHLYPIRPSAFMFDIEDAREAFSDAMGLVEDKDFLLLQEELTFIREQEYLKRMTPQTTLY